MARPGKLRVSAKLPEYFCWTKFGTEAGEVSHAIFGRKEIERRRNGGIFLWGIVATSVPLIIAIFLGRYVFKFHPAILFGVCAGVRTTTAALGMVQEAAKSKVPALGYGMPYAIGITALTIFGMIIVLLMSKFGG
jgi:uncharacterized transporter YbjL